MSDQELIDEMFAQSAFSETIVSQIGNVERWEVDRAHNKIHFYGTERNCSFDLGVIESSIAEIKEARLQYKGLIIE